MYFLTVSSREDKKNRLKRKASDKKTRYWLMGLATVGGGIAVAVTGGLAAPLIAAGTGAILGTASATALSSTVGLAVISSLFGAAGAGLTGYRMNRRYGNLEQFQFAILTNGREPHLTIAISGWLLNSSESDFHKPWSTLYNSKEQYTLIWETEYLNELGSCLSKLFYSTLISEASIELLKQTALAGVMAAAALPAIILKVGSVIDNPWSVCCSRAIQAGKQLADVLLTRKAGKRPITLIGFSLGARVIYYCLEEMRNHSDCKGIIENVILLGTPVTGSTKQWNEIAELVAGKVVNGYCRNDWILHVIYRASSTNLAIAGLSPIESTNSKIINVDLSKHVSGHLDYAAKMELILETVNVRTVNRYHEEKIKYEKQVQEQ
ncbi:uncharacterized protein TRIADDRAFT_51841 [Trichoplax adhaerens]|uniref:Transmembrane and coiled-coil domain-containing protein 4 n=1 Tax=Trichoplax adhaerens TaxID=10228 RepID=B3RL14_TRIAD|nr:hypothetical protein TRIADDRAFT_51841 [Trichoplax adhaerens]EDV28684.1 hypothetical protein TRIADDRAFT_51841 [Trichoplax adhaerens]|eukprot:XP_002107886.1 hypothetical protein TRIADDRAFT_51841 [Trichoplax adhaerens]